MLSTLELCKRELKQTKQPLTISGEVAGDATVVLKRIDALVRLLESDQRLSMSFVPKLETEYYDAIPMEDNGDISPRNILFLNLPLLSLTSLTLDGTLVDSDDILLLPRGNIATTQIKLLNGQTWPFGAVDVQGAIAIAGEWAYHEDPVNRWLDSTDSVATSLSASATTVTVNDADGLDITNDSPRFSEGQLIKIDDEYMSVRMVTGNILTVRRGMRGTTAASHSIGATIYVWSGVQAAQDFVTRAATLQYRRRGEFVNTTVAGVTEVHWPTAQTLPEYKALLQLKSSGGILS
jgi:hypothetical protein